MWTTERCHRCNSLTYLELVIDKDEWGKDVRYKERWCPNCGPVDYLDEEE